jgi:hypothetical protein
MKKIILSLLFLYSLSINAQSFAWVQTQSIVLNASAGSIGYPTTCDASGNIYLSGFVNNGYLYADVFGDIFYNKYDPSGQILFSKTISGKVQIYDMQSDSSGNMFIAAAYIQTMTIDSVTISTTDSGVKPILIKLDANGNHLWHIELSTYISSINHFKSIAIDANDAVYIAFDNYNYSYIKKLDSNGNVLLTIEQQNVSLISSVSIDNEGYIYAAGGCANANSKYAGVLIPSTFSYNTYIVKYSPNGVYQWVKYVQDITCSEPQVMAKSQNEVYFSSALYGAYVFDNITAEGPNGGYDFFLSKLNSSGVFQWVREVPGTGNGKAFVGKRKFLNIDTFGNVCFAGSTSGTVNWGNNMTTNSTIYQDGLVLKYDSNGTILMAKTAGGADTDRFDGITANNSGAIFVSGLMRGTSNFDAIQHVEIDQYKFNPVLSKINATNLNATVFNLGIANLYPNPATDSFTISNVKANSNGAIYTLLGKKIKAFKVENTPIYIQELATGIYIVKLDANITFKLIKS